MKSIEIQTDNPEIIEVFRKLAEAFKVKFTEKDDVGKVPNASPSNNPYFESLKIMKTLEQGIAGRVEKMSREEFKNFLGI